MALRRDIMSRLWWCPTCAKWVVAQGWVMADPGADPPVEGEPGKCAVCGHVFSDFMPIEYPLSSSRSEKCTLLVHHYCYTCQQEIPDRSLLVPLLAQGDYPTLSQWAVLMADALIWVPENERGPDGKAYRNGPIHGWVAWCPHCLSMRCFSCRIITEESKPQQKRRKRVMQRRLPKTAARYQSRMFA